jgi:uncharacterized protein YggU (UPF0235/DUF167 family)
MIRVKANPKASRSMIKGLVSLPDGAAVVIAVAAPPIDGEANIALATLLAKALGVAKSSASVEAGTASRIKRVLVRGDGPALAQRLATLVAGPTA